MPRHNPGHRGTINWHPLKPHGLRNKKRKGRSTYSRMGKGRSADYYGTWINGVRQGAEKLK